ncbi:YggS family pyridoxal phosphate-dependent enzyme [Akkermansia sp.]|uniref:YggS family pyridoxal phosphate-dependent enzyme n=1 Tax=Akkermansia sp. TaxID=1872421 RepID=UPI0039917EF0
MVAVSKTFPACDIRTCYDAGQRVFGENRVQEALEKIPALPPDTEWHLIGPLQRNKVRKALEHFTLIHAVDSLRLAHFLDTVAQETGKRPRILLEVNVGAEDSKFGFSPELLEQKWEELARLGHIEIAGLMCIPLPWMTRKGSAYFRRLRELRDSWPPEAECRFGALHGHEPRRNRRGGRATLVRVGTAIFGGRTYAPAPSF